MEFIYEGKGVYLQSMPGSVQDISQRLFDVLKNFAGTAGEVADNVREILPTGRGYYLYDVTYMFTIRLTRVDTVPLSEGCESLVYHATYESSEVSGTVDNIDISLPHGANRQNIFPEVNSIEEGAREYAHTLTESVIDFLEFYACVFETSREQASRETR